LTGTLFAFFVLGERFKHPVQYIGALLCVLAVLMIHHGDKLAK